MKPYTYLLIDFACLLIPFLASFYPKHPFYQQWKYFFPANFLVGIFFLIWDYFFTKAGFWGFNPDYLTGVYIANLPIEEVLFFLCIPYACTFTFFALKYLINKNPLKFNHQKFTVFIIVFLSIVFCISFWRWYTSFTFLLLIAFFIFLLWKKVDLSTYYLAYLLILPFFFLSNGILTGTIIEKPIVWYNDSQNLGIRIGTIPVEDSMYGMLLIFMNIYLMEVFQNSKLKF